MHRRMGPCTQQGYTFGVCTPNKGVHGVLCTLPVHIWFMHIARAYLHIDAASRGRQFVCMYNAMYIRVQSHAHISNNEWFLPTKHYLVVPRKGRRARTHGHGWTCAWGRGVCWGLVSPWFVVAGAHRFERKPLGRSRAGGLR